VVDSPDWPLDDLREILQSYHLRAIRRERLRSGPVSWWSRSVRAADGHLVYDPEATWTETHYSLRRDLTCEVCEHRFGYQFDVTQISRVHKAGWGTDGMLKRELGKQLRRRIRCPNCRHVQTEPRRHLLRADIAQLGLTCGMIAAGLLAFVTVGLLGGWMGGILGFFVGLVLAVVIVLFFWFHMFFYILGKGPSV
jgi:hypothetical protein